MFKFYEHQQIDLKKWDECVMKAKKGNLFCMSWYLDIIHPGWNAFIIKKDGDYHAIFPLLEKRKWGLRFHPKPPLAQKLGLICRNNDVAKHQIKALQKKLRRRYVLLKYPTLNYYGEGSEFKMTQHFNFLLPLNKEYKEIMAGYRRDRKARVKQAKTNDLRVNTTSNTANLLQLYASEIAPKIMGGVEPHTLYRIDQIAKYTFEHNIGCIVEATNEYNEYNTAVSTALFIHYNDRIVYVHSATDDEGRKKNANSLILDWVINKYANKPLILDFEGSDVPGIADFFISFGAQTERYYILEYARWWVKLLIGFKKLFIRITKRIE